MDNFINLAKQGYGAYQSSQQPKRTTEHNNPENNSGPQFNHQEVVDTAKQHGSGDSSLFHNAMGYVNDNQHEHNNQVDEQEVQDAHNKAYNEDGAKDLSAQAMGGAAAMQILKKFTSAGGGGGGGGGGSTSELMSLAMAEASKLFDSSGGAASGGKQEAVNGAAMTVMKLLVQSKFSGLTGGSNSGGMGSLIGLASKFM